MHRHRLTRSHLHCSVGNDTLARCQPFQHLDLARPSAADAHITPGGLPLFQHQHALLGPLRYQRLLRDEQCFTGVHGELDLHEHARFERPVGVGQNCPNEDGAGYRVHSTVDTAHLTLEWPVPVGPRPGDHVHSWLQRAQMNARDGEVELHGAVIVQGRYRFARLDQRPHADVA